MHLYLYGRAPSSGQHQNSKQNPHRSSIDWDRLRDTSSREHRLITAVDPRSPRVRPSLSLVQWGVR